MTEIEIKETGKERGITVVDPKSGLDLSKDLISNASPEICGYNDDGCMIMTQDNFDWWFDYCTRYEKASNKVYEFFNELKSNCWSKFKTYEPADTYQLVEKLKLEYYDYMCNIEFNDLPAAMLKFVEENKGGKNEE